MSVCPWDVFRHYFILHYITLHFTVFGDGISLNRIGGSFSFAAKYGFLNFTAYIDSLLIFNEFKVQKSSMFLSTPLLLNTNEKQLMTQSKSVKLYPQKIK